MSKRMPLILPLIVTLSAGLAIAIWLWPDEDPASSKPGETSPLVLQELEPEQDPLVEVHEENQNGDNDLAVDRNSDMTTHTDDEVVDLAASFLSASRAIDAEDAILKAESYGLAVSADWRMQLDVACNPDELEYISGQTHGSRQYFAQKLSSYCNGYVPDTNFARPMAIEELDQNFLDLVRTRSRDQLSRNLSDISPSETDEFLVRRLRSANTPEEIQSVGEYLAEYYKNTGQILWRPEVGGVEVADAVIARLQQVALELYSCQIFGGCGPDSLKVLRICAFNPGCEPGWSYEQFVFANHSPLEMEYIQGILGHIYSG